MGPVGGEAVCHYGLALLPASASRCLRWAPAGLCQAHAQARNLAAFRWACARDVCWALGQADGACGGREGWSGGGGAFMKQTTCPAPTSTPAPPPGRGVETPLGGTDPENGLWVNADTLLPSCPALRAQPPRRGPCRRPGAGGSWFGLGVLFGWF